MMNDLAYIINADDFGRDSNVNAAVLQSFKRGWISSTTIMANMPGFDEACEIVSKHNLQNHVGLHCVLTEGTPLTDKIKAERRFCDEHGEFRRSRRERLFRLTADEKEAMREELRTQIERCRGKGLRLTHVDSHHHIHEEMGVLGVVIPLMREFDILYIRIMGNTAESCTLHRCLYTMLYNGFLKYRGLSKTHYFGSVDQYIAFKERCCRKTITGRVFEIMTHPMTNSDGIIVDALNRCPMERLIGSAGLGREARSFSDAVY